MPPPVASTSLCGIEIVVHGMNTNSFRLNNGWLKSVSASGRCVGKRQIACRSFGGWLTAEGKLEGEIDLFAGSAPASFAVAPRTSSPPSERTSCSSESAPAARWCCGSAARRSRRCPACRNVQHRKRNGALGEYIDAAPPGRRIGIRLAHPGAFRARLEQRGIDVRMHRRTAHCSIEIARDGEDRVTDGLAFQPPSGHAP